MRQRRDPQGRDEDPLRALLRAQAVALTPAKRFIVVESENQAQGQTSLYDAVRLRSRAGGGVTAVAEDAEVVEGTGA